MRVMLVGLVLLGAPTALRAQSVAIVDVTVIPMDRETTLAHQTVIVRGERILSVGPAATTPVPDDAVTDDGTGRYLVPGLTDAHVHLAGTVFGPGRAQFGDAPLYLAYGVTTVMNLGGKPEHLDWRRRIIAGELLAPTIYTSPPFFNEPRVNSPEEVEREIAATVAAGYDRTSGEPVSYSGVFFKRENLRSGVGRGANGRCPVCSGVGLVSNPRRWGRTWLAVRHG